MPEVPVFKHSWTMFFSTIWSCFQFPFGLFIENRLIIDRLIIMVVSLAGILRPFSRGGKTWMIYDAFSEFHKNKNMDSQCQFHAKYSLSGVGPILIWVFKKLPHHIMWSEDIKSSSRIMKNYVVQSNWASLQIFSQCTANLLR